MSKTSCGLDFGTSNSTLGMVDDNGVPYLQTLEGEALALPSVLFFNFEDDKTYFGQQALSEYVGGAEGRMLRALKSVLGTSLMSEDTRIRGNRITFVKILEIFLTHMRAQTIAKTDQPLTQVVAGRPIRFVDDDNTADQKAQHQLETAIKGVGFKHVEFQFEPIAAALDYEQNISTEQLALVVDIGGGTSDFTVIRLSPTRAKFAARGEDILATGGVHVGGTNFDQLFSMAQIMPALGLGSRVKIGNRALPIGPYYDLATWHRINRLYTQSMHKNLRSTRQEAASAKMVQKLLAIVEGRYGHLLASHIETSKIKLTQHLQTELGFFTDEVEIEKTLFRDDFETAIADAANRIPATIRNVLRQARIGASDVQTLIMTGGSTQIPFLRRQLDAQFPNAQFVQNDAFGSVGLGLALDASRRF